MKKAKFTIEYLTHCLANSPDRNSKCDRFDKDNSGRLIWGYSWWYSAITRAVDEDKKFRGIKPNHINIDPLVEADIDEYSRRINDSRWRRHEAIFPGTEVTFTAMVNDRITETNLEELLSYIGSFIGMTPFGFNIGFGRFKVVHVEVEDSLD